MATDESTADGTKQKRKGNRIVFKINLADVSQESTLTLTGVIKRRNVMMAIACGAAVIFFLAQLLTPGNWVLIIGSAIISGCFFIVTQVSSRSRIERVLGLKVTRDAKMERDITLTRQDVTIKYADRPQQTIGLDQVKSLRHDHRLCLVEFQDGSYLPIPHAELTDKKYDAIVEMLEESCPDAARD